MPTARRSATAVAPLIERKSVWILGSLSILCFIAACITMWSSMQQRASWQESEARISASDIVNYRRWNTPYYRFQAEFTFVAQGRRYYVPYSYPESSPDLSEIEAQRAHVQRQRIHRVFYNPANPADVLFELDNTRFFALPLILTIGAVASALALLVGVLGWNGHFCPSCGTGAAENHRFCTHCGLAIPARKGKMLGDSLLDKVRVRWHQPVHLERPRAWGRITGQALLALSLVLATLAAGRATAGVWHLLQWRSADAHVVSSRVIHSHDGQARLLYRAAGTFRYEAEGRQYTANGESLFYSHDFAWLRTKQAEFAPRSRHTIRVHPTDPNRVVFGSLGLALLSGDNPDLFKYGAVALAIGLLCWWLWRPPVACHHCKYKVRRHFTHCPYCGCNGPLRAASQSA